MLNREGSTYGLSSLLVRTLNRKGAAVIAGEYTPEDTLQVRGSRLSKSDKLRSELQSRHSALFSCQPTSGLVTGTELNRAES